MFMRLLDTLLPAVVLAAMVLAMAAAFGALSPSEPSPALRVVQLDRVVISAERSPSALASAEPARTTNALR